MLTACGVLPTSYCFPQSPGAAINATGAPANSSAILDVSSTTQGLRIPRVALTTTTSALPIVNPVNSLLVYDTVTIADITPGFYYWDGTGAKWVKLATGNGSGWLTSGNAGTDSVSNFIGTTDAQAVVMKTNNTERMRISRRGNVGIGTASPVSSAILDVSSTTKGMRMPRMTSAQRNAIVSPAVGLQIFNIDCNMNEYFTGTCWVSTGRSLPDPGIITSSPVSTDFCAGQTRTYSISAVTGATNYTWTVPAGAIINSGNGTTSINVTFGNNSGNVCVNAGNSCETSGQSCISVIVRPLADAPGSITGITTIYPNQAGVTYSITGTGSYTWTVPPGTTIISGQGTNSITVNFACSPASGSITVAASNSCGTGSPSTLAVTMNVLQANAGSNVFGGAAIGGSPTASAGTSPYTYSWSPATDLSSSTLSNPNALCNGTTTTYTVTVTDAHSCTATSSVIVTRNLIANAGPDVVSGASIGGTPTAVGGNATYSYLWNPVTNLSSSTVSNPTALCSGPSATYTVTVTDANNCTATSSMNVSRGTGGTITQSGGYTIHTFTSTGTFTPPACVTSVEVLVVAGGGGAGTSSAGYNYSGGGGGGGVVYNASFPVSAQAYPVTVGNGGGIQSNGQNSVFSSITAIGGGRGGSGDMTPSSGGSGGGGGGGNSAGASGTSGQGYAGGNSNGGAGGAGGGGAGGVGSNLGPANAYSGGNGGVGLAYSISGSLVYYGGGGGGTGYAPNGGSQGSGGLGGGGGANFYNSGGDGAANTGGGGCGSAAWNPPGGYHGGLGGSGIVIIRY